MTRLTDIADEELRDLCRVLYGDRPITDDELAQARRALAHIRAAEADTTWDAVGVFAEMITLHPLEES